MRIVNPVLVFTLWASLAGCASAGTVPGAAPGEPSSSSAPEAPRPLIAQVLAAADPLQVEAGIAGGHGHSGHQGQQTQPAPQAPQEAPAQGSHAGHGSPAKPASESTPKAGGQGGHSHHKH